MNFVQNRHLLYYLKMSKFMKTIDKLKVLLGIIKKKFSSMTIDGIEIFYDGDEIEVDTRVFDNEGNPIADGEYTDGEKVYVVKDGAVVEIRETEIEKSETAEIENSCEKKVEGEEEKKETEETVETTETTETTETEEKPEEEEKKEDLEEPVEPTNAELQARIEALEKGMEELLATIMEMKEKQIEETAKNEEIIREFSQMTPSAQSITVDNTNKIFSERHTLADKLNYLKNKK